MKVILRFPTEEDIVELERCCLDEWAVEYGFVHYFESILKKDCKRLIKFLPGMEKGEELPPTHVPCTFYFAFDLNNKIVGRTSIRHSLTASLKRDGGHIGYAVMPGERKKGYATAILKESLTICKQKLDLDEVLITCDDDNIGSIKTIEKNNGVLIDKVSQENSVVLKRRYRITLK